MSASSFSFTQAWTLDIFQWKHKRRSWDGERTTSREDTPNSRIGEVSKAMGIMCAVSVVQGSTVMLKQQRSWAWIEGEKRSAEDMQKYWCVILFLRKSESYQAEEMRGVVGETDTVVSEDRVQRFDRILNTKQKVKNCGNEEGDR